MMCYNVLCDKFATRQMYGYCPSWALEWEYRKKSILDEIRHYAADIISLQVSSLSPLRGSGIPRCTSYNLNTNGRYSCCCLPRRLKQTSFTSSSYQSSREMAMTAYFRLNLEQRPWRKAIGNMSMDVPFSSVSQSALTSTFWFCITSV